MSPTPAGEPAKRRRRRLEEPAGQGTLLDFGPGADVASRVPGDPADGTAEPVAPPEEPEWLRDLPLETGPEAAPLVSPEEAAKDPQPDPHRYTVTTSINCC